MNIWRRQPSNRLLSSAFIPKNVTNASVNIANDFFEILKAGGWVGKISGVINPAKVMGVAAANMGKVKGVA